MQTVGLAAVGRSRQVARKWRAGGSFLLRAFHTRSFGEVVGEQLVNGLKLTGIGGDSAGRSGTLGLRVAGAALTKETIATRWFFAGEAATLSAACAGLRPVADVA